MAHFRRRLPQALYDRLIQFSPILGIFGHRQVGKSTWSASLAKRYFTLDDRTIREQIHLDPKKFVRAQRQFPAVIDECQIVPDLFPALKEHVRTRKKPGQFILTGSVRFTSRRAIRESLAGRIVNVELYPFIVAELREASLPDALPKLVQQREFSESTLSMLHDAKAEQSNRKALEKYLLSGGLPGLCFIREERLRREALQAIHQLILDRDLRMIVNTRLSLESLLNFIRLIATNTWQPYNASEMKRGTGLSHQTQQQLLYALESIFLIRRIAMVGRAGETFLMEDQYEEHFLSGGSLAREEQMRSALYRNARAQFSYRMGLEAQFSSYWTRSGARVPLVLQTQQQQLGLIVFEGDAPSLSQYRSADSFLRRYSNAKVVFAGTDSRERRLLDTRSLICPVASLV